MNAEVFENTKTALARPRNEGRQRVQEGGRGGKPRRGCVTQRQEKRVKRKADGY
jgi:hypothetical protein